MPTTPAATSSSSGIEGDTVRLRPDLRDTEGWWFYWGFRVRGAQGRSLTFAFSGRNPIGVRGPAVSTDGGRSWSWLGAEAVKDGSFQYAFAADAQEVRFCFAIPYQEENLKEFLAGVQGQSGHRGPGTLQDANMGGASNVCTSAGWMARRGTGSC